MRKNKMNRIPLNVPNLVGNEWKYLKKCIDTNWISTAGNYVDSFEKKICKDKKIEIKNILNAWLKKKNINVIIATGGTGLTKRDITPEVFKSFFEKDIPGFGEIFRMLSYKKIKTSTIQSRACAGISNGKYLFSLPGSPSACKDAWDEIIKYQLDSDFKPCNLVEILPKLK